MRNLDGIIKQVQEEARVLRANNEKLDATAKVAIEQLDTAKKALEEVSVRKQQEIELLNKETTSLAIKERDAKHRAYELESSLV